MRENDIHELNDKLKNLQKSQRDQKSPMVPSSLFGTPVDTPARADLKTVDLLGIDAPTIEDKKFVVKNSDKPEEFLISTPPTSHDEIVALKMQIQELKNVMNFGRALDRRPSPRNEEPTSAAAQFPPGLGVSDRIPHQPPS